MATITGYHGKDFSTVATNAYAVDTAKASWSAEDTAKFYRPNGWLSAYSLACGYVESAQGTHLTLDGCYHVQGPLLPTDSREHVERGTYWETFGTYTEAKRDFVSRVKTSLKAELKAAKEGN